MSDVIKKFLKLEAASGIILIMAAMLAMILANTALAGGYQAFLDTPVQVRIAALDINKPLLLWINDGFMAIFFLLVGLEVKREMLEGGALLPGASDFSGYCGGGRHAGSGLDLRLFQLFG